MCERLPAGVGGRVAGPDKLDALEGDPRLVAGPVEPTVLHNLTQERDDSLCSCGDP